MIIYNNGTLINGIPSATYTSKQLSEVYEKGEEIISVLFFMKVVVCKQ